MAQTSPTKPKAMDASDWEKTLIDAGLEPASAKKHSTTFTDQKITIDSLSIIDRSMLSELGITAMGEALAIIKLGKSFTQSPTGSQSIAAKPPKLSSDMTSQQFRKFLIDWDVYIKMTNIITSKQTMQLYNCADDEVQTSLINTNSNFFKLHPDEALKEIEKIVTQKVNPLIHRLKFATLVQSSNEPISNFVVRLKSSANDCNFSCPKCTEDISETYIKDQFVRGVLNESLQTDLLAKAGTLTNLNHYVSHAETFEAAMRDQSNITTNSNEIAAIRLSTYRRHKQTPTPTTSQHTTCSGCGSKDHGAPGSNNRHRTCPAWGKTCTNCGKPNHFAKVCRLKDSIRNVADAEFADMDLVAHVTFDQKTNTYTSNTSAPNLQTIVATVSSFSPQPDPRPPRNIPPETIHKIDVFPDSGATICLCGPQHLKLMKLCKKHLIPSKKIIRAVGGSTLVCMGWVPIKFVIGGKCTKQALYVCDRIQRVYLSKIACIDVGILSPDFPLPSYPIIGSEAEVNSLNPNAIPFTPIPNHIPCPILPKETVLPSRPQTLPFPPLPENVPKLKQWLLDSFSDTAFRDDSFPTMTGPPAHIHLQENAIPRARHTPIPIPYHFKEAVEKSLWNDVARGIIAPVPVGTPTDWCATMVITPKKDGRPRRTVDYQYLNSQCKRETHHTSSPLQLAIQIPARTKKTVLDAVDGYHSVPLDEASQPLTTFITEWGRFMYLRMPQGYLASGDAYTRRYDDIIKDVPRKVKIVDDALLYDDSIEQAFFHTFDYLCIGAQNGIVFNKPKFQFCQDVVQFAGLQITTSGIAPSDSMLKSISEFPTPRNLQDARSWFGLVNQVAWAYSLGPLMQPFRDMVKGNAKSPFVWNESLEKAFHNSKQVIVNMVKDGITTFDLNRTTCLATDWSKDGMGFMLFQKYCQCSTEKAPICCSDGWRLVYAGSRFCTDAESRYAPIEGEATSIAWALDKCRLFVLGCPELIIVTDHEPLKGILGDRDLSKITNPRLFKIKEKTLRYRFKMQYCPGKWHKGSDAMSRYPATAAEILGIFRDRNANDTDIFTQKYDQSDLTIHIAVLQAITELDDPETISPDIIRRSGKTDENYIALQKIIQMGFPKKRSLLQPEIKEFWEVRKRLCTDNGLILMDNRIVIPKKFRKQILISLHSAHQGVTGMKARANETVYWPGMDASIRNYHANCMTCVNHSPSNPKEPIIFTPSPEWPFQHIVMDLCYVGHHTYLVCADRLTGWLIIYHLKPNQAKAEKLITICRSLFETYGAPDEISSDGGPPFSAHQFQRFLISWDVKHRVSSVAYPQSNGRAELAVKAAKRIIYGNTGPHGSINNDKAARAVLQYRNTPIQGIGLSPAQLLLHRRLKDSIPAQPSLYKPHPEWIKAAEQREEMLAQRNQKLSERYNISAHSLPHLSEGDRVAIQNQTNKLWSTTGKIVECLPNRQYKIRVDGSGRVTLRNRRFLRTFKLDSTVPR